MRTVLAAAIVAAAAGMPAFAHRLDEYLQGALISVEKNELHAQMTLTPGVAVYPFLISSIDTDGDGAISETEQRAYAGRVLGDLSMRIDGRRLTPQLVSIRFPDTGEMKEGRGEIHLDFRADLPAGGPDRKLTIENHHQSRISAYQVNCLVPRDPVIRIASQNRNYSQSFYELNYFQSDVRSDSPFFSAWSGGAGWVGAIALLLLLRGASLWRRRVWLNQSTRYPV